MGRTILISSGKGGTGKSTIAVNISVMLNNMNYKVLLLDMDMGMRTLDIYLGAENRVIYDAYDVVKGLCSIEKAQIAMEHYPNLKLMAASPVNHYEELEDDSFSDLITSLKDNFDFVIIDAPTGTGKRVDICSYDADEVILVTTPEYASLRATDALDGDFIRNDILNRKYIINKAIPELMVRKLEPDIKKIEEMLRCDLLGIIQYDDNIHVSTNLGIPIISKKDSYITRNFEKIAKRII